MSYTLREAAKATGKGKATIHRALQNGKISGMKDEATGEWTIDPAELHRVFPLVPAGRSQNGEVRQHGTADGTGEAGVLWAQLEHERQERERERLDKDAVIDDLRHRLDTSEEERRKVQTQLTALLTDQRGKATEAIPMQPPTSEPIIPPTAAANQDQTQAPKARRWFSFGKRASA